MRLFCTTVLVVAGGCVDHSVIDLPDQEQLGDRTDGGALEAEPVIMKAAVCDARIWEITPDAKNLDLQVVETANGATVLQVPKDGGAVRAFRLDHRGELIDRDVVTLRDDRNYTGVSASVTADRFVVASVVGDTVALDIFRDDLGARHNLGDVSGTLVTDAPMLTAREQRIALVGGQQGLVANTFAGGLWEPQDPFTVTKSPIVSVTATQLIDDTILAWSTENHTCHLQRFAGKQESMRPFACTDARIAMNEGNGRGQLVFIEDGTLFRADIVVSAQSELGEKVKLAEFASSPRVAFDGTKFWISYINAHGDVVVGFLDKGRLASRALEGVRPVVPESYDLSVFSDGPWVVTAGSAAFGALRMCPRPL